MTLTSFNTALPPGFVLASFTANTTNGNSVAFTMSTLTPGKRYFVKVGGFNVYSPIADNDGVIRFSHSDWPAGEFTVVEDGSTITPTPTPTPGSYAIEDIDQNGVIDMDDLNSITISIVLYVPCPRCDVNKDGKVDVLDARLVSKKL